MKPEYLRKLADVADPKKLWKSRGLEYLDMPEKKRQQLDMGVALRRYASHLETLQSLVKQKRSLLITPLTANSSAIKSVKTPREHEKLRRES